MSAGPAAKVTLSVGVCKRTSVGFRFLHLGCTVIQQVTWHHTVKSLLFVHAGTQLEPSCLTAGPALQHGGHTSVQSCALLLQLLHESPCCTMRNRYFGRHKNCTPQLPSQAHASLWEQWFGKKLLSRLDRGLGLPIRQPVFCQAC